MATTSQSLVVAVALLFNLPSGLFADMGFGPRFDVTPRFRFENLTDYPEYDFYLKYGHGNGNPHVQIFLTKIPAGDSFPLEGTGERMTPVVLVAVPAGQVPPPPPKELFTFAAKNDGPILESDPLGWDRDRVVVYRVGIDNNQLGATRVKTESSWGDLYMVLVGTTMVVGTVILGLWLALRGRRKQKA
jgi:hypothetical protein